MRTVLTVAALTLAPAILSAHGTLRRSVPAAGAVLGEVPREVRFIFSEPPERALVVVQLVGPDSVLIPLAPIAMLSDSAHILVATIVGPVRAGRHSVRWQAAFGDGHPVRGTFAFTVAEGAIGIAEPATEIEPDTTSAPPRRIPAVVGDVLFGPQSLPYVVARWTTFVALLIAIGAAVFAVFVLPRLWIAGDELTRELLPRARERARWLGLIAAALLFLIAWGRLGGQVISLYGRVDALDPDRVGALLVHTTWGQGWLIQTGSALALVLAYAIARRRPSGGWTVALLLALPLAVSAALAGHPVTSPAGPAIGVTLDAAHVLGASAWLGGLAALVLAGIPAAHETGRPAGVLVGAMVRAFSPIALAAGLLVVATGVTVAAINLGSLGAITGSGYGRTLLLKVALVLVALAAGAYNWRRVRPSFARHDATAALRRVAGLELAAAVLVLLVTAVLVATSPP